MSETEHQAAVNAAVNAALEAALDANTASSQAVYRQVAEHWLGLATTAAAAAAFAHLDAAGFTTTHPDKRKLLEEAIAVSREAFWARHREPRALEMDVSGSALTGVRAALEAHRPASSSD